MMEFDPAKTSRTQWAGVAIGVSGVVLWLLPQMTQQFMGRQAYQAGQHNEALAYVLLFSMLVYSVLSWVGHLLLRALAGVLMGMLCLYFYIQAGDRRVWALDGLVLDSFACVLLTINDVWAESRSARWD